jgi:hypothetical protein
MSDYQELLRHVSRLETRIKAQERTLYLVGAMAIGALLAGFAALYW